MKNFNEYILNKLYEAEQKSPISFDGDKLIINTEDEDELETWVDNHIKSLSIKDNVLKYNSDNGVKTTDNEKIIKLYKEIKNNQSKSNKKDDSLLDIYPEDKFELLGKTVGYRSALALLDKGDDFHKVARDVMDDDDDYSLKQLGNLYNFFSYAAAIKTTRQQLKKKETDHLKTLNKNLKNLNIREATIETIKKIYKEQFEINYRFYETAFNNGLKEIREEMSKPDFKWLDPATKIPPKGKLGKITKYGSKVLQKIGSVAESLANKIPSEHNLENDMARLACFGVKCMFKGLSAISKLFRLGKNYKQFKKQMEKTKLNQVNEKIDKFKKEYDEYKKNKDKKEVKKESIEFKNKVYLIEDDQQQDPRKEILNKLNNLMYETVIPYYYCKLLNIICCFDHKDECYVLKETENGWNTKNISNGKLTYIEDNTKLMLKLLNDTTSKLNEVFIEFSKEKISDFFNTIPNEITYNAAYSNDFKKFIENIDSENEENNNISKLLLFLNVYNNEIIKKDMKTYNDFVKYIDTAKPLLEKVNGIKPLENIQIKYKDEKIKVNIPGILRIEKEEQKEENNEAPEKLTKQTDVILKSTANLITHINDENFEKEFNDYKNLIKTNQEQIISWLKKDIDNGDESRYNLWNELDDKLGEYKKQIIPTIWRDYKILDIKSTFGETYKKYYLLSLLNENDDEKNDNNDNNENDTLKNQITTIIEKITDLIKSDENNFITNYKKWVDSINTILKKLLENKKYKDKIEELKDKDPLEQICNCVTILKNTQENKDSNGENKEKADKQNGETEESTDSEETK